jgi:hypothetical protein
LLISRLLYLVLQLRVNILFAVSYLARAIANSTNKYYVYALQIVNYLYTYKSLVMRYKALANASNLTVKFYLKTSTSYANSNLSLYAYSNASFANAEDCKSISSYLFKFASGTIYYKSSKQQLVTTSITKAEYVS